MRAFVDTEIGRFPRTWQLRRLEEVFETQLGKMLSQKAHRGDAPKRYLRNKNVQWGNIDVSDLLHMDFSEREKEKFQLRPGDLLVCEGGVPGRAAIWNGQVEECYYQKALHRLRPRNGSVTNEFMLHWLRFAFDLRNLYGVAGASSTIAHLPEAQLKALPIPVPPFDEQRAIAAVLRLAQQAIEQQSRLLTVSAELKSALMHRFFTEGLQGEAQQRTEIGTVPQSWVATTLGELACKPHGFLQTGPFGSQLHKHEYLTEGVGVVNPTHLSGNRINHYDVPRVSTETAGRLDRHILQVGDILFARRGEIGRHGMVTENEEGWLCGTGCFLARVRQKHVDNRFLSYLFSTRSVIVWLKSHAAGAIMPNLNNTVLRSMPVFFPEKKIQIEIADCLDAIEEKVVIHQRRLSALTDLFRTLLHQLMTAQVDFNGLEIFELSAVEE
jgi:type I restriction enzyme S subunit